MTQPPNDDRDDGRETMPAHATEYRSSAPRSFLPRTSKQRTVVFALSLLTFLCAAQVVRELLTRSAILEQISEIARESGMLHSRPLIERDGRRFLWALGQRGSEEEEWFDVTDSKIDPEQFQYGLGKDLIASIDSPQFLDADDPRLIDAGINGASRVIGFVHEGDARAYPLHILNRHELVNDIVGGKPVTVGW